MKFGYGRVSTDPQDLQIQRAALEAAGCDRIFEEKVSGASRNRPELERLLDLLRPQDELVVVRLDRLARSTRDLLDIADRLSVIGAGLVSLAEPWAATGTGVGRLVVTILASIAEFELSLIKERTGVGRQAARARGVRFGRPAAISLHQWAHFEPQLRNGEMSATVAARLLNVHPATVYRLLRHQ